MFRGIEMMNSSLRFRSTLWPLPETTCLPWLDACPGGLRAVRVRLFTLRRDRSW
jgi:hypothetical protein